VDHQVAVADIEQLLAQFLTGALGLTLRSAVQGHRHGDTPGEGHRAPTDGRDSPVWVAWQTDRGMVSAYGAYDRPRSRGINAHVLFIGWWIAPSTHHEGWWRCDVKRPQEWTKGRGGELHGSGTS
jgi:hypothetical protein